MKKKKRDQRAFVGLHKELLFNCAAWAALSPAAKVLYLLLKAKLNPNKGDTVALSYRQVLKLQYKGLSNNHTVAAAFAQLEHAGWIEKEQRGGLFGQSTRWKLTGKYDGFNTGKQIRGRSI